MSLFVEGHLDTPILRDALASAPSTRVHFEQETLPGSCPARLIFRAVSDDYEAFEAGMVDDWTVKSTSHLAALSNGRLYRVDLAPPVEAQMTYPTMVELDIIILGAVGTPEGWNLRMQFPDRDALSSFIDVCRECDVGFTLEQLYTTDGVAPEANLTDVQRETLETALDSGYFDIPRSTSVAELGDELGISGQAVSERLRRALREATKIALRRDRHGRDAEDGLG